ncbi:MAG: PHP domain-containing protein [Acidobacteria bacterium]|nr:PHP domain-containing protein [Acidobacteriota bacterium]
MPAGSAAIRTLLRASLWLSLGAAWAGGRSFAQPQRLPERPSQPAAANLPQPPLESQRGYRPLVAALHVHSRFSNGEHEILELARYARQRKIDVLGITDSFLTRVRYGLWPWRRVLARSYSRQSVLSRGIENYLASFQQAQRQFDDLVLLPGVEVAPYYYWQGSFPHGLDLHAFDRHLLVFGLGNAAVLRDLPVIENETWTNTTRDWKTLAGPVGSIAAGVILFFVRRTRTVRLAYFSLRRRQSFRTLGCALVLAGGAWMYDAYPFGRLSDPYSGRDGPEAFQRLVDYVDAHGGVTFWSYPEAGFSDVHMGGARMVSRGHPEDLSRVDRYRGFEGIYGGWFTVQRPGGIWDQVLGDYIQGRRQSWPSVITGIDFHYFKEGGGWYELNRGQTVLWSRSKDVRGALDALRHGRGYAIFQPVLERDAALRNFALQSEGKTAFAGETLQSAGPARLTADVGWEPGPGSPDASAAQLEVIRDGSVIESRNVPLPLRVDLTEALPAGKHYYRLRVVFRPWHELLSNPIFWEVD